ncbi:MAG: hypothetical protein AB7G16_04700 [Simkaniaceae bacterium]
MIHLCVYECGQLEMRAAFIALIGIISFCAPLLGAVRGAYHNHFAIELDYVLLRRANSQNKHLVEAAGGPINFLPSAEPPECAKEVGKTLIASKDLIHDMQFTPGFSGAIKIFPSIWSTWEARYTGGVAWEGIKTRNCLENLSLDGGFAFQTQDYNFASRVKSLYYSKMYNLELDYWRHITPRYTDHFSVSWMAGLTYFNIEEKIKLYFTKTFPVVQTSRYRTRTDNTAFGLQIGGRLEYNPYHFLTWGFVAKMGGLFNRDKVRTLMLDQNNTFVFLHVDRSGSTFAYMGQFFPYLELRPTKHFFFQINYQVLFVGNLATAAANIKLHGTGSVLDDNSHIIYHGLTGGIQFNF